MLLGEPTHLGKHDADVDAEESPFEAFVKKQRWEQRQRSDDRESREMLAWELEQERWSEKTNEAILHDPHWQRVGIKSESSTSDDEQQQTMTPTIIQSPNQTHQESLRPPTSGPARLYSPTAPEPYFFEDKRMMQRPASPSLSVHSAPRIGATFSPSNTRPTSPASVRSASTHLRYHDQQPNYAVYPTTPTGGRKMSSWPAEPDGQYMDRTNDQLEPARQLTMRMKPFPPSAVQPSLSMSGPFPNAGMNREDQPGVTSPSPLLEHLRAQSPIVSPHQQSVQGAASFNSYHDADQLEAEFARLETVRGRNLAFPGIEERDEQDAIRSTQDTKTVFGLDELEQEYERLEIQNKQVVNPEETPIIILAPSDEEIIVAPEEHDDGVIHLEDQPSLGDDEPEANNAVLPIGVHELEAEFDEAVRRKALMRNCSMNSNEGDDILGDSVKEVTQEEGPKRAFPSRKSRWQEKLERFERRGLDAAEASLDVSKYPRLQQIRQRRRERLKALMSIRQERAEIWSTLEANWEHMENSMTRTLESEAKNRGGQDPEPATKEDDGNVKVEGADAPTNLDEEMNSDSLRLSDSEPDSQVPESANSKNVESVQKGEKGKMKSTPEPPKDGATVMDKKQRSETGKEPRVVGKQKRAESPRSESTSIAKALERPSSQEKTSTVSIMNSISCTLSGKDREESAAPAAQENHVDASLEIAGQKEDPPPSSFGVYMSQSMSDVGTKVVNAMKGVRSHDEQQHQQHQQQPSITFQRTDTAEDDTSHQHELDDDDRSNGIGLDTSMVEFEEEDEEEIEPEPEQQGCPNPVSSFLTGKQRRIVVENVTSQSCLNPFLSLGFERAAYMCGPGKKVPKVRNDPHKVSGNAKGKKFQKAHSDIQEEDNPQVYVVHDLSDFYEGSLDESHALSDDKSTTAVTSRKHHEHHHRRRSKKSKHKKAAAKTTRATVMTEAESAKADAEAAPSSPPTTAKIAAPGKGKGAESGSGAESGGVDTFFTLVDDLLVNKILGIIDEKSVNSMAHTFGFD